MNNLDAYQSRLDDVLNGLGELFDRLSRQSELVKEVVKEREMTRIQLAKLQKQLTDYGASE